VASRASRNLPIFRNDIQSVIAWSEEHFGVEAADRYGALIRQAISDLLQNPVRPGSKTRGDLARDAYVYHLMFSRDRVHGQPVKNPRHVIVYRYAGKRVEFARLLHDSRDLERHLPSEYHAF
jgi:toxin ParE1/3/4